MAKVINSGCYLKVNLHKNKVKFFQSFNSIYAKLGNTSSFDTIMQLMQSNCLSVLLYSLESLNLTKTNLNYLEFPLKRAFVKIFHVRESDAISWCQFYMKQLPIEYILDDRKRKYLFNLGKSECFLLKFLFECTAKQSLNAINEKYGVDKRCPAGKFNEVMWQTFFDKLSVQI